MDDISVQLILTQEVFLKQLLLKQILKGVESFLYISALHFILTSYFSDSIIHFIDKVVDQIKFS